MSTQGAAKTVSERVAERVAKRYKDAADFVVKTFLSKTVPTAEEIDITEQYRYSQAALPGYVTLDYEHRRDIRRLSATIVSYFLDPTRRRPLNIMMHAEPGSGKSYLVSKLAASITDVRVTAVSFNMAAMQSVDELRQAIEQVRSAKVADKCPILFLDEFDSEKKNFALLLPLLWDGEIHIGHGNLSLGKVAVILAGSDTSVSESIRQAKNMDAQEKGGSGSRSGDPGKLRDLLSRINGGDFQIPPIDMRKSGRDRRVDKVCMALSLLHGRFGERLHSVSWNVLRFIAMTRFRYGVRSIAHLVDMLPELVGDESKHLGVEFDALPLRSVEELQASSLAYHIVPNEGPEDVLETWRDACESPTRIKFVDEPEEIEF